MARENRERGQTSLEYLGVIVVVATIVLVVLASAGDIGRVVTCGIGGQIQKLAGGDPSGSCDGAGAAGEVSQIAAPAVATAPNVADPGLDMLVGDLEGVGGYPSDGRMRVRAAFLKKLVCKIPGIKQICKWTLGKLEDEVVKACAKSINGCKKLVDKICKIGGKVCDIARELSCLALDVLCKKAKPKPRPRLVAPFNRQRNRVVSDLNKRSRPQGSKRARGRRIDVRSPHDEAHRYFRALTRGPGVKRIKKSDRLWEVRTPDGRRIRLRNPKASSEGKWTVDVRPPGASARDEIHYKFFPK